jgi:hypothetical protein
MWDQLDADYSRQTGIEEDCRDLHPALDGERRKMMMKYKRNVYQLKPAEHDHDDE